MKRLVQVTFVSLVELLGWLVRLLRRGQRRALLGWLAALLSGATHAQSQSRPVLRLDLLAGGPGIDQTYVYFEAGATTGYDASLDATKLPNSSGLNLASFEVGGQQLAINALPPAVLSAPFPVVLFLGVPQYGPYTLQVGQLDNFSATDVYLLDNLLNTSTLLALNTTYAFELTAANTNNTYTTADRFTLLFTPSATPLPVTLTRFTAVAQAAGVQLAWGTASEQHSAYFGVERSPDGQAFGEIGRVAAAGTSTQAHAYALLDAQPLAGVAYYRLRQVDVDGTFQYSPVRVVARGRAPGALSIFPSPAHAAATLLGAAPGTPVQLFDTQGRLVASATADAAGQATLALPPGLAAGLYVVRAGTQSARLAVE
jgi:hypothetical protein